MKKHPYAQFENTENWKILKSALLKLKKNKDVEFNTPMEYILGFLVQSLYETKIKPQTNKCEQD
ncbi:hypothetical protein [Candidatus Odyssella acanthamoebae]|uniref:Uncharacterized protein n=1 Tax=Candidatus Odyssella acanthamoebae TaxID=91604 RepID=A0A077AX72_9PROT|nr:hypothetical protein [Candidatus Paracaedibacter acanthamoebae]AIK97196.1 hypothetical protein ID47_11340 [Candidatus Paracaedibacter acanthamoebae]